MRQHNQLCLAAAPDKLGTAPARPPTLQPRLGAHDLLARCLAVDEHVDRLAARRLVVPEVECLLHARQRVDVRDHLGRVYEACEGGGEMGECKDSHNTWPRRVNQQPTFADHARALLKVRAHVHVASGLR